MAGLSGTQHIKAILAAIEQPGRLLVLVDCAWRGERDRIELDPREDTYFCGSCGRRGKLEALEAIAEGLFMSRHKVTLQAMTTRPGVERGGGKRAKQRGAAVRI